MRFPISSIRLSSEEETGHLYDFERSLEHLAKNPDEIYAHIEHHGSWSLQEFLEWAPFGNAVRDRATDVPEIHRLLARVFGGDRVPKILGLMMVELIKTERNIFEGLVSKRLSRRHQNERFQHQKDLTKRILKDLRKFSIFACSDWKKNYDLFWMQEVLEKVPPRKRYRLETKSPESFYSALKQIENEFAIRVDAFAQVRGLSRGRLPFISGEYYNHFIYVANIAASYLNPRVSKNSVIDLGARLMLCSYGRRERLKIDLSTLKKRLESHA
jgi:hypothetical protein